MLSLMHSGRVAQCVCTVAKVSGTSMQPTLNAAEYPQRVPFFLDHVLINRLATRRYDFQRGDVVTLWSPESQGTVLIKRIVGVAGDWVSVPVRAINWLYCCWTGLLRLLRVLCRCADRAQPASAQACATRAVLGGGRQCRCQPRFQCVWSCAFSFAYRGGVLRGLAAVESKAD